MSGADMSPGGLGTENQSADGPGRRNVTELLWRPHALWRAVDEVVDELAGGAIDSLSLVVHYSGYGYDTGGAPGWLADALEGRPSRYSAVRLVSMFHELYATGRPWQRAFWNSSRQRISSVRVARASDALITNREQSARWLERMTGRAVGSVPCLPVPSNIGEPLENLPWESRGPQVVTFGGARFKRPVPRGPRRELPRCCAGNWTSARWSALASVRNSIERCFDRDGIEVVQTGFLAAPEVSEHFRARGSL